MLDLSGIQELEQEAKQESFIDCAIGAKSP